MGVEVGLYYNSSAVGAGAWRAWWSGTEGYKGGKKGKNEPIVAA